MTRLDWVAVVALGGMLTISLAHSYLRPPSITWARHWLQHEVGGSSPRLVGQLAPVLRARARTGVIGALVGGVAGLAFTSTVNLVPGFPGWTGTYLGAYAGRLVGLGTFAIVRVSRAAPRSGVRVALSTPPRTRWFVSRPALVTFILAAAVQLTSTVVGLSEAGRRAQLDRTDATLIMTSLGIMVVTAVASVRYIP